MKMYLLELLRRDCDSIFRVPYGASPSIAVLFEKAHEYKRKRGLPLSRFELLSEAEERQIPRGRYYWRIIPIDYWESPGE